MPSCTFLVGVPGSGKSTWISHRIPHREHTTLISTDHVIEYIADAYEMTYDESFKDLIKFAEKVMWKSLEDAVHFQDNIVIDRTNLTEKSRARFIKYLEGYKFYAVVFPTPEQEEWERRLNSRPGKTIPKSVLESMHLEYPKCSEGFEWIQNAS